MSAPDFDPSSVAVLFVECQNGLLGEGSVMPIIAEAAKPVLPAMGRLAAGARAARVQVVHLTYFPVANNRSSNRRPPMFGYVLPTLVDWTRDATAVQVVPEIGVGPDDLVLPRNTGLSPTYGTETFKLLRNIGIETVVLAGISANVAIPVVAVEAADEDFAVIVARDAVAGAPSEYVDSMFKYTLPNIARVRTVDELLAAWRVSESLSSPSTA
jgi:nicotinamidase-related amidase